MFFKKMNESKKAKALEDELIKKTAEQHNISFESCQAIHMKFKAQSNNREYISLEKFNSFFSFTLELPMTNLQRYLKIGSNGVNFSTFVFLFLAVENVYNNSHFLKLFYNLFLTENGFNYMIFISELRANMLLRSKSDENDIISFFESKIANPNGYLTAEQFQYIVSPSSDILEKAKLLIFGSYIFT